MIISNVLMFQSFLLDGINASMKQEWCTISSKEYAQVDMSVCEECVQVDMSVCVRSVPRWT